MVNSIPLFVVIPLGCAFILPVIGRRWERAGDLFANLVTVTLLGLAIWSVRFIRETTVYHVGGWGAVNGIPIGIYLVRDGLSIFMLVVVNLIAFVATLYSINYMEYFTDKTKYYTLFMLMLAGMNGVILTGDFFNLYVFIEIAAIASYALVAFGTEAEELEAAFKYQVMGSVGSGFILLGIILLYSYTGTLNMADVGRVILDKGASNLVWFVNVLFIVGFGLKAAVVPFHMWLPDAHPSAPAPISAMLSGVLIESIGVYPLTRIMYNVIGFDGVLSNILIVLAIISMMIGGLLALWQWDYKRLLAYSSISQVGYILLGIGLGTPLGLLGALFHLFNHSAFKGLLFLDSGSIVYSVGTRDLREMGELDRRMPITSKTNLVAAMSIAGVPPFNGFWSKLIIIIACIQAGRYGVAGWAILGSILTFAYILKAERYAFYGKAGRDVADVKESPPFMCVALIILAVICVVAGLMLLPNVRETILFPVVNTLTSGTEYIWRVLR